jgi:hypothetical protein
MFKNENQRYDTTQSINMNSDFSILKSKKLFKSISFQLQLVY